MRKLFFFFGILCFSSRIFAGGDTLSTTTITSIVGVNLNQITLSNWTQGGDNSISWSFFNNSTLTYTKDVWSIKNNLKLAYGRTKQGDADSKINDNEFFLESVVSYSAGWKLNPFLSNTIRTVLDEGFDYKATPFKKIAAFFDPGYITQSMGFEYSAGPVFSTRMGLGLQETFTSKFNWYSDDPDTKTEVEKFKFDTGVESVSETSFPLAENMGFSSKLRLFSRFKSIDVWDVRWDNTLTAKINKYFNVNLNYLLIYQKDQSVKTQTKQTFLLGFTYNLL